MTARPRRRRKTTARGLGSDHQRERRDALKRMAPGAACPRCGGPMYHPRTLAAAMHLPPVMWDLDLDDFPGRVFGGPQVKRLAHRHCNRKAGAILGNRLRAARRAADTYNRW